MSSPLSAARRIVVKVGSALLVDPQSGRINRAWLQTLVASERWITLVNVDRPTAS